MDIPYKITIRFPNGYEKIKRVNVSKQTLPFLIMRLRQQYIKAFIDWEGGGDKGTTEIGKQ